MMVGDIGKNRTANEANKYRVGDRIRFRINYMAVVRLLNSKFIDKRFL